MDEENGIRRVVWIPKKLDQEIEAFRGRIGYTRSGFYRYAITRQLEQLLFSKRKEIKLLPWDEVVGTFETIETDSEKITVVIACTQNLEVAIPYAKDTPEATIIENSRSLLGQKIAIIRTDEPERPIIIENPLPLLSQRQKVIYRYAGSVKRATLFGELLSTLKGGRICVR